MNTGTEAEPPQSGHIVSEWLALVLIWSTTPLAVVLSLRDLDAVWSLTLRLVLATALALLILRMTGLRLAYDRAALQRYLIGALNLFGAMMFTYLGARHLPSGLIAVLFGTSPLMVGALSHFWLKGVRLAWLQWAGMVMGLAGLAVIFVEGDKLATIHAGSAALVLCGVLCYAISAVWLKRLPSNLSPLVQTTGALCLSALCCVLALPFLGGPAPQHMPGLITVLALLYGVFFGSIVAMLCYFHLMQHVEAGTVALTTLLTPVLALLLGIAVNHERFRAETLWGMGLILLGLLAYYEQEIRRLMAKRNAALPELP